MNTIFVKDIVIARLKNSMMDMLQIYLQEVFDEQRIQSNTIEKLINRMDQGTYGLGTIYIDIDSYFHDSRAELSTFFNLVATVVLRMIKENFDEVAVKTVQTLQNNLMVYLDLLKNNKSINRDSFYSPSFWIGGANILYCTNFCLKKLREWLQQLIIKKGLEGDQILSDRMDQLDQSKRDPGYIAVSVDRLFGQTNNLAIFVALMSDVCDAAKKDKEISEEDKEALYFFLGRLVNYLKQVRNKIEA